MKVLKRTKKNGSQLEDFNINKIIKAVTKAYESQGKKINKAVINAIKNIQNLHSEASTIGVETIQNEVEQILIDIAPYDVTKAYIIYREKHNKLREYTQRKLNFIKNYKKSTNTANATVDDNSNVNGKNIGILNSEIHKEDNIQVSRRMIMNKLQELYPNFNSKQYMEDLNHHIIYKHDESSFAGAIAPYCCSITMYPFLIDGIKGIGGLSAAPKNLDSFCGMYINLIFATSAMFAGACATSELLLYFTYFCKKEWGDNFYLKPDTIISSEYSLRKKTIRNQIHQYWQQIIYSINQPAAARGMQSAFINFSYFDKPFFEGMFGDFYFPDGTKPDWESLNWIQKEFMQWFNQERLKCMLTFPVESYTLLYKNGEFLDKESAEFVAEEYSRGHSFFTYISDSVDSLSSCCFSKDTKVLWKNSYNGVKCTTLEELYNTKNAPYKDNLRIFHNGSWVRCKSIKLSNRPMYKVTTYNNKEFIMSDNHINVTYNGEKPTSMLIEEDYLMFNTSILNAIPENDEHLIYDQGLLLGLFIGNGIFINEHSFQISLNKDKWDNIKYKLSQLGEFVLDSEYNNLYKIKCDSKELTTFISKWTTNEPNNTNNVNKNLNLNCILQSIEFRNGILDGWNLTNEEGYNTGYSESKSLIDAMEILCTSLGLQTIINMYDKNYPLYKLKWYKEDNFRIDKDNIIRIWKRKNNSFYWRIKSIEPINYTEDIYCIECYNQDEPYFTLPSGLITHNCRLKNKIQTKEFNFTNGNIGIQTGSKSVITLNLNRIIQDFYKEYNLEEYRKNNDIPYVQLRTYIQDILDRVYKYHIAYNELLWDMYNSNLLPVYSAGFINLDKQYLTIGINGLNQAAEFVGIECNKNKEYEEFCQFIFSTIKDSNTKNNGIYFNHKVTYNTECVPAESLAIKNYNWDKEDGYYVSKDTNLYASYIFKPNDTNISILDKMVLHGKDYIGDFLDGGAACHINLDNHLSKEQYLKLLYFAAKEGCQYFTYNIPNSECGDCGYITKVPINKCPKCGSEHIYLWDRPIGYLSKVDNWSKGRQKERETRVYTHINKDEF